MTKRSLLILFAMVWLAASWLIAQQAPSSNDPTPPGPTGRYQLHEFAYQVEGQPVVLRIDTVTGVTHRYYVTGRGQDFRNVWQRVNEITDQPDQ